MGKLHRDRVKNAWNEVGQWPCDRFRGTSRAQCLRRCACRVCSIPKLQLDHVDSEVISLSKQVWVRNTSSRVIFSFVPHTRLRPHSIVNQLANLIFTMLLSILSCVMRLAVYFFHAPYLHAHADRSPAIWFRLQVDLDPSSFGVLSGTAKGSCLLLHST